MEVQISGIPATIKAGDTVGFTATVVNRGGVARGDVAPLFQIVGGPCGCAQGSLQRLNGTSGTWQAAPMPEGDGNPNYLATATGGITVPPRSAVTIHYRLTLSVANPPKLLTAVLYAVQLPAGLQLAISTTHTQLIAG
jgi:hypothetical protein